MPTFDWAHEHHLAFSLVAPAGPQDDVHEHVPLDRAPVVVEALLLPCLPKQGWRNLREAIDVTMTTPPITLTTVLEY